LISYSQGELPPGAGNFSGYSGIAFFRGLHYTGRAWEKR
jgi:hypothetical protein